MKKLVLLLCLALFPAWACAQDFWKMSEVALDDVVTPVGVEVWDKDLYVTNMGPSGHGEYDGYIIKHDMSGNSGEFLLKGQINSPKSFEVFGDRIILIDPYANKDAGAPFIVLADSRSDAILDKLALPEAGNPNDIVQLAPGSFVVSDPAHGKLFLVTVEDDKLSAVMWAENVPGAKGLAVFNGTLYVAGYAKDKRNPEENVGMVYQLDPFTPVVQEYRSVDTPAKALNAVAFRGAFMFASDWNSKRQEKTNIYVVDTRTKKQVAVIEDIPGPSGLTFVGDSIYIPAMVAGKIVKIDIDFKALEEIAASGQASSM